MNKHQAIKNKIIQNHKAGKTQFGFSYKALDDRHFLTILQVFSQEKIPVTQLNLAGNRLQFAIDIPTNLANTLSSSLRHLDLNNNKITQIGLKNLAKLLENCNNLKSFNLSYNKISEADDLVKILNTAPELSCLFCNNNKLEDGGAIAIANGLKNKPKLTRLNISNIKMTSAGISAIIETLKDSANIKELYLNNNICDAKATDAISYLLTHKPSLHILNLDKMQLNDDDSIKIFNALANKNCMLQHLYLERNHIGKKAMLAVEEALKINQTLQTLYLNENEIDDIDPLANALVKNTSLLVLSMAENKITNNSAIRLARSLESNTSLRSINLEFQDGEEKFTADFYLAFFEMLNKNATLIKAILDCENSNNYINTIIKKIDNQLRTNQKKLLSEDIRRLTNKKFLNEFDMLSAISLPASTTAEAASCSNESQHTSTNPSNTLTTIDFSSQNSKKWAYRTYGKMCYVKKITNDEYKPKTLTTKRTAIIQITKAIEETLNIYKAYWAPKEKLFFSVARTGIVTRPSYKKLSDIYVAINDNSDITLEELAKLILTFLEKQKSKWHPEKKDETGEYIKGPSIKPLLMRKLLTIELINTKIENNTMTIITKENGKNISYKLNLTKPNFDNCYIPGLINHLENQLMQCCGLYKSCKQEVPTIFSQP